MFRTMTISLYSTEKRALFRMASTSVSYPLVRNRRDFSTRRGVSLKPSRDGSSPISASKWRIVSCIFLVYLLAAVGSSSRLVADGFQAAAGSAAPTDPEALYRRR